MIEGWVKSLERLFAIPEPFREERIGRGEALRLLNCGEDTLKGLLDRGLRCGGQPGEERFDENDLFNLALYSGSGQSVPEIGFQFALRWMGQPSRTHFERKRWSFEVGMSCARAGGCGEGPRWSLARPRPELHEGQVLRWRVEPPAAATLPTRVELEDEGGIALRCLIDTRGERRQLRSRRLGALVEEFTTAGYRWIRMPEGLQRDPEALLSRGVANCISASAYLTRRFRAEGFQARSRRGWLLGVLDIEHAWVEVLDEDGETKTIDPIFALLAGVARGADPELASVVMGSPINRLLPSAYPAEEPLVQHSCGGAASSPVRRRTEIRAVRAAVLPGRLSASPSLARMGQ